ncbi:MAG: PIN domain-containing protein [Pseudomonadota bacterium]|nr:PIN domain-containing protein [Pseudomonadota bacterium]
MSVESFVDTNILLYAASGALRYPDKHQKAWDIIRNGNYAISGQVLAEFYVNATKAKRDDQKTLDSQEAASWIDRLSLLPVVPIDHLVVQQAVSYSQRFMISYWDAALVAAAEVISAPILYTEDLNHGQKYGSVTVINPFKAQ